MTPFSPAGPERRSLFGEILDWMLAPLLVLWPLSLALTWLVAEHVANLPYDRALAETVTTLVKRVQPDGGSVRVDLTRDAAQMMRSDSHDRIYYQVLGLRGELVSGDRQLPVPPLTTAGESGGDGSEIHFRHDEVDGERVRVAYRWVTLAGTAQPLQPAVVQVAETLGKRGQLATEIVKAVVVPEFVILPLAVLLVWAALVRGLAPLTLLQRRIRARASDDLSPIDEREAPEEVSPLVAAINDLLQRQHGAMQTQKRFLADAAHQLKTPLAGLRTQAELAQREIDSGSHDASSSVRRSLQQMSRATQGATRMVNQLLSIAHADSRDAAVRRVPVDLEALAKDVVHDFVPRALEKRIDLGYEGPDSVGAQRLDAATPTTPRASTQVQGHPALLRELIVNLVDNALHYTPSGGTVTLRVLADPFGQVVVLQVEDSGPGIPSAERELVFQPFYRSLGTAVEGSGLGLAIVAEVARQHGATVSLEDARDHPTSGGPRHDLSGYGIGARFTVRLPALAPAR